MARLSRTPRVISPSDARRRALCNNRRILGRDLQVTVSAAIAAAALAFAAAPASAATPPCRATTTGGDWPAYGHDVANTRSQPAERALGPAAVAHLAPAWVFSTSSVGDSSGFETTPVVSGGCVYIGSAGGVAYALDASSGRVVWRHKLDAPKAGTGGAIVGAAAVDGGEVVFAVNALGAPYAVALDRATGALRWHSAPIVTGSGYFTDSSPVIAGGLVVLGYSPAEAAPTGAGGFALLDPATGATIKTTQTIPPADQAKGYYGAGLWSTPAYDRGTQYLYWGSGNPHNKSARHPNTDAILKIDLDRSRPTFGQIVGAFHGDADQYSQALEALDRTPACTASGAGGAPYPLGDPVCGQLNLDFGASVNLFHAGHTTVVGGLQKSGVYHAARADTLQPLWSAIVGTPCEVCNAASPTFDGASVDGVASPGTMFSLGGASGARNWVAPVGDGVQFQSISSADGVVWTIDSAGFLDAFDAHSGQTLTRRPIAEDVRASTADVESSGVSIAEHTVFAATTGTPTSGYLVAYRTR
jgi:polyvinyl alcohol dehydrogenase (cytochrome)